MYHLSFIVKYPYQLYYIFTIVTMNKGVIMHVIVHRNDATNYKKFAVYISRN